MLKITTLEGWEILAETQEEGRIKYLGLLAQLEEATATIDGIQAAKYPMFARVEKVKCGREY